VTIARLSQEAQWRPALARTIPLRNRSWPFFVELHKQITRPFMPRISYLALCAALALATSACGDTPGERALTGGAIGAGGGALVGAAAGNVAAGAIVGGLGGAAIGAATTPRY
jgi:hypothetical protein